MIYAVRDPYEPCYTEVAKISHEKLNQKLNAKIENM